MTTWSLFAVFLLSTLLLPSSAKAEDVDLHETSAPNALQEAIAEGAFSPLTLPSRVGAQAAIAWGMGGFDSSRRHPVIDSAAEVRLWGPLAVRGGATYSGATSRMRPNVGLRMQFLQQDHHGLDGAIGVFYKAEGFTEAEGEIETVASFGRTFDKVTLVGNLAYGQDPEGNERDGEVRLMALHGKGRFSFGADTRARFAIGPQHGKAATTEPTFDGLLAAQGTVTVAQLVFFVEMGPSVSTLVGNTRAGVAAMAGLGSAF